MKKQNLIVFFLLALIALSCKRGPEPTKAEMLSKVWKVRSVSINGTKDDLNDYSSYRFDFRGDGKYLSVNPTQNDGNWSFNSTETKLVFKSTGGGQEEADILDLTDKKLLLQFTEPANDKQDEQVIVYHLIPA